MPSDNKIDDKPNQQNQKQKKRRTQNQSKRQKQLRSKMKWNEIMQNEFAFALSSF